MDYVLKIEHTIYYLAWRDTAFVYSLGLWSVDMNLFTDNPRTERAAAKRQ